MVVQWSAKSAILAKEQSESLLEVGFVSLPVPPPPPPTTTTTMTTTTNAHTQVRHELELARKNMRPLRRRSSSHSSEGGSEGGSQGRGIGRSVSRHGSMRGKRTVRHPLNPELSVVDPSTGTLTRGLLQRQTSLGTSEVLATLPTFQADLLAQKLEVQVGIVIINTASFSLKRIINSKYIKI